MSELSVESIKRTQKNLDSLYERMDTDRDLYFLKKFKLKDWKGREVKRVHNITLNTPAVYANQVMGFLATANQQIIVEGGGVSNKESRKVEEFLEACFADIDCRLEAEGYSLMSFLIEQACLRGRLSARCVVREEDKIPFIELSPWDTRHVVYRFSNHSLEWAAYISERTREDIEEDYAISLSQGTQSTVMDAWSRSNNMVWADRSLVLSQPHALSRVPVGLSFVPVGSYLVNDEGEKHKGESIYQLCRDLFPEQNKLGTVLQTMTVRLLRPPVERKSQEGENAPPLEEYPYDEAAVYNVDIGGGITPAQLPDIQQSTRLWYSMLESYIQRGTLSTIDYGNLTFPLSGSAIAGLMATNEPIYWPRLQALSLFYRQISRMLLKWLDVYGELEVGEEGHKRTFRASDMQGNYTIKFKYFTESPIQDIGNYSTALQAEHFLDKDTIRRDILKLRDPDGIESKINAELAESVDPALKLKKIVHGLISAAEVDPSKDADARMEFDRLKSLMIQRHTPGPTPLDQQIGDAAKAPQAQGIIPMFPGQTAMPSQQEPPTRQQLQQEEEYEQANTQRS